MNANNVLVGNTWLMLDVSAAELGEAMRIHSIIEAPVIFTNSDVFGNPVLTLRGSSIDAFYPIDADLMAEQARIEAEDRRRMMGANLEMGAVARAISDAIDKE